MAAASSVGAKAAASSLFAIRASLAQICNGQHKQRRQQPQGGLNFEHLGSNL
jgi:hypothetical protein